MMKCSLTFIAAVFLCLILTANEAAAVPMVVTHQGRLLDGATPADGFFDIEYRIFTDSSGGTELWSETHNNVDVKDGLFTV